MTDTSLTSASVDTTSSYSTYSTSTSSSSSDIDWDALIESAVLAKQTTADSISTKMTEKETEIAAYEEMQELLQGVLTSLETVCGTGDSLLEQDDIFSSREAYLTSNGDVTASDAVVVTADEGADIQTYDLEILQLAKAQKIASSSLESKTDDLGLSGTISLTLDGMDEDAVEITIDEDMSLSEIAEAINFESDDTGVSASIVQVSDTEYRLVLSADETGMDIDFSSVSGDDIFNSLGITDDTGAIVTELQASQDAIISLDGIEVTRDSNVIDDVIEGVSFSLYQTTGDDSSISVEVSQSLTDIKTAISDLVDAYNTYREWAITQQEVSSDGGASEDATLFGDNVLRSVNSSIADAFSTMIDGESMALLGLSYDENNYLELDDDTLNDALLSDLDEVEDLLNFQFSSSSSDLALLTRSSDMPSELTLDIVVDDDGAITSVSVDGDDSLFEISGSRIIGVDGSDYEDITFVFTGDESKSIDVTTTSGIAENLMQSLESYADADDSILTDLIEGLEEQYDDYEDDYEDALEVVEDYRERLIELYASYQEEISEAESSLSYLEAILYTGD